MLRCLRVSNFAIVEDQSLELSPGLNALTGETGAGKSILIEALGFLLGARGSAAWLRAGSERLIVTGIFDREDFPADIAAQFKIAEARVLVRRELDASGKTRALVNGQSAPVSVLSVIGDGLVDFHGQHEHQTLLKPLVQLELLDRFGGLEDLSAEVSRACARWSGLREERESAQLSEGERSRRIELGRLQLQDIDEGKLRAGEEEELEALLPRLKNAERLKSCASAAYELLCREEGAVESALLKAGRALEELSRIDQSMTGPWQALEGARLELEEVSRALGAYRDKIEADPGRLDQTLSRLDKISRLKKKYGATASEVLAFRERLAGELDRLEHAGRRREELEGELAGAEEELSELCERLHARRLKAARKLETAISAELKVLGLAAAHFCVGLEMEDGRYSSRGADEAEFLLAPNPGEPLKPVKAIASGGELSRVMLALKTVLARADRVPVLVFDEVDAGVGGAVARAVGARLAALGESRQVLCVTHLAQVACFARSHFHVAKEVSGGRTSVLIERLDGERRLEAVARMLGGREATAASRRHAKELLESSLSEL